MINLKDKPFVVIDLGAGRYLNENEGHEKYNEVRNKVTGKFYGYAPPYGNIDIKKLGAKKDDESISDVHVIYTKKKEDSNNRIISSFIENATIYANKIKDPKLKRSITTNGNRDHCSYCIESDDIIKIDDIPGASMFEIILSDFSTQMFRAQRFYKGTYPDLDDKIIKYLENLPIGLYEEDDNKFQEDLQNADDIPEKKLDKVKDSEPEYFEGSNGRQVKKNACVSKAALKAANYKCEVDPEHHTFKNKIGKPYMEGHHLIPCTSQNAEKFWAMYGVNIDCAENIICLCPTCHRQLHYGNPSERNKILKQLFSKREKTLKDIGIEISLTELEKRYL